MSEETSTNWASDDEEAVTYTEEESEEPKKEKETTEESSTEETSSQETSATEEEQETTPDDTQTENNLPWHKDPRWKEFQEKSKNYDSLLSEVERLKKFETEISGYFEKDTSTQAPQWFVKMYGDDPEIWSEYQKWDNQRIDQVKQEAVKEIEDRQTQEQKKEQLVSEQIKSEIKKLKDEGLSFDENALKKVVLDNQLFDLNGNLNFRAGYELLQAATKDSQSTNSREAKKKIASKTAPTVGGGAPVKEYTTPEDIKRWRNR